MFSQPVDRIHAERQVGEGDRAPDRAVPEAGDRRRRHAQQRGLARAVMADEASRSPSLIELESVRRVPPPSDGATSGASA
jgi:hypothetical protein